MRSDDPDELVERVARNIAATRRARGLTQDDLAELMGTATKNLQRIEAGQNLTLRTLARIAVALEVRAAELMRESAARMSSRAGARKK